MHTPAGIPVQVPDAVPTLTLTVVVDGTQLSMALSDAQAMGHIASCSISDEQIQALRAPIAHPFTRGALLFEQLFPTKIRNVLQHSASRAIYLQLDESLLAHGKWLLMAASF